MKHGRINKVIEIGLEESIKKVNSTLSEGWNEMVKEVDIGMKKRNLKEVRAQLSENNS